jgi:nucleoid-associated protein YgaU
MSNPFSNFASPIVDLNRKRRQRFKVGVTAGLVIAGTLLLGMLIQGCHSEQLCVGGPKQPAAELSGPPANLATVAELKPHTNVPPFSAAKQFSPNAGPATNVPAAAPCTMRPAEKPAAAGTIYAVKSGDTLLRIAKAHGTTVRALKAANDLQSDRLVVGEPLKIPAALRVSAD